jgi:hypothetical protein
MFLSGAYSGGRSRPRAVPVTALAVTVHKSSSAPPKRGHEGQSTPNPCRMELRARGIQSTREFLIAFYDTHDAFV